jgi:hypothetical protein
LHLEPISNPIGPNPVLQPNPVSKPELYEEKLIPHTTPNDSQSPKATPPEPTTTVPFTVLHSPLETLLFATFETLNRTAPNLTEACWLCYSPSSPFYEAIGINSSLVVNTTAPTLGWEARPTSLIMTQVSGQGTCVGQVPKESKKMCTTITECPNWNTSHRITPAGGAWWACSLTGLTPLSWISL